MTKKQRLVWVLAALCIGIAIGYARVKMDPTALQAMSGQKVQLDGPVIATGFPVGGPFTLIDQDGRTVTEKSWPNKYLLIYFGFTHCPDVCPLGLGRMADTLAKLPPDIADRIQPVFITLDPARDTPAALKDYVRLFRSDLIGLTGTQAQIDTVIKAFRVYAEKVPVADDPNNYMMNHSSYTYLMAPFQSAEKGSLIDVYQHEDTPVQMADKMLHTIRAHMNAPKDQTP